jgi:hypothetical protein
MSLPNDGLTQFKVAGSQVLPITDLKLPSTLSSGQSASGSFTTCFGAQIVVVAQMASSTATIKLATAAASNLLSFGSASLTTGTQASCVPGSFQTAVITTSAASPWVGVNLVDGGNSSGFSSLAIFALYMTTLGENHNSVRTGFQAVASKILGDGSGVQTGQLAPQ